MLLTAYADTDAAIRAINAVRLDYYLLKPWDPPEEQLYPVLDDLLEDWKAGYRPPYRGLRVLGHRWSPASHEVRDFLARNQVPYRWLDVETDPEARRVLEAEGAEGSRAAAADLRRRDQARGAVDPGGSRQGRAADAGADQPFYDLVIVGGGPAGSGGGRLRRLGGAADGPDRAAGAGRAGGDELADRELPRVSRVVSAAATWPGGRSTQAARFGVEILAPQEVTGLRVEDAYRFVTLGDGGELSCHARDHRDRRLLPAARGAGRSSG